MLELNNVTIIYPDRTKAVDDVSLTLAEGETVALIGANGAGKTSLMLGVVGILEPSGGTIAVDGITLDKKTVSDIRRRVGLVFQNPDDQLFMPRIFDDVAFGCRNYGMSEAETKRRVEETLDRLGIAHLRDRSPLKLSGGERRMAAIATVLAMEPSVLMFDEPSAFLDPRARRALIETLKTLGHAKLIATHDMALAAEACTRVIVMSGGRIEADGDVSLLSDAALLSRCGLMD